jgi:hypothetical protein
MCQVVGLLGREVGILADHLGRADTVVELAVLHQGRGIGDPHRAAFALQREVDADKIHFLLIGRVVRAHIDAEIVYSLQAFGARATHPDVVVVRIRGTSTR